MTVAELIDELGKYPGDTPVLRPGHPDGGGYDDLDFVLVTRYDPNGYPGSYAGYYAWAEDGIEAVVLT